MNDLRQAAEMALEALEMNALGFNVIRKIELAIDALESALAKPDETETLKRCLFQMQEAAKALAEPEQEPVDLLKQSEREGWRYANECELEIKRLRAEKREWVRLTDKEIDDLWNKHESRFDFYSFSCDIEAKLKEKNSF